MAHEIDDLYNLASDETKHEALLRYAPNTRHGEIELVERLRNGYKWMVAEPGTMGRTKGLGYTLEGEVTLPYDRYGPVLDVAEFSGYAIWKPVLAKEQGRLMPKMKLRGQFNGLIRFGQGDKNFRIYSDILRREIQRLSPDQLFLNKDNFVYYSKNIGVARHTDKIGEMMRKHFEEFEGVLDLVWLITGRPYYGPDMQEAIEGSPYAQALETAAEVFREAGIGVLPFPIHDVEFAPRRLHELLNEYKGALLIHGGFIMVPGLPISVDVLKQEYHPLFKIDGKSWDSWRVHVLTPEPVRVVLNIQKEHPDIDAANILLGNIAGFEPHPLGGFQLPVSSLDSSTVKEQIMNGLNEDSVRTELVRKILES
jgi:hypothetical protein